MFSVAKYEHRDHTSNMLHLAETLRPDTGLTLKFIEPWGNLSGTVVGVMPSDDAIVAMARALLQLPAT